MQRSVGKGIEDLAHCIFYSVLCICITYSCHHDCSQHEAAIVVDLSSTQHKHKDKEEND